MRYAPDAVRTAVYQSSRYIPDRFFPDKAIDLLDEAGAKVKLRLTADTQNLRRLENEARQIVKEMKKAISDKDFERAVSLREREVEIKEEIERTRTAQLDERAWAEVVRGDIEEIIASWTGIPVTSIQVEEAEKLLNMETTLSKRVIGQDRAIDAICRAIRRSRLGVKNPNRPMGSFIFLGPSGSREDRGRAEARGVPLRRPEGARPLRHVRVHGEARGLQAHRLAARLRRSRGGGQLTERIRRQPYSVILLDEIEKAHPDIANLLLQILEDGQLTDAYGNVVDFKNTLIIMTSNIGTKYLVTQARVGFGDAKNAPAAARGRGDGPQGAPPGVLAGVHEPDRRGHRLHPAQTENLRAICRLLLDDVAATLKHRGLELVADEKAVDWLLSMSGQDVHSGRPSAPTDDPTPRRGCGIRIAYRRPGAARVPRSHRDRRRADGSRPLGGRAGDRAVNGVQEVCIARWPEEGVPELSSVTRRPAGGVRAAALLALLLGGAIPAVAQAQGEPPAAPASPPATLDLRPGASAPQAPPSPLAGALPPAPELRTTPAADSKERIAEIVVRGGRTVTAETISFYLGVKVGDPYDAETLRRAFSKLWESGLFEDLRLERETVPGGSGSSRSSWSGPGSATSSSAGNKKLTTSQLKDKLKEGKVEIRVGGAALPPRRLQGEGRPPRGLPGRRVPVGGRRHGPRADRREREAASSSSSTRATRSRSSRSSSPGTPSSPTGRLRYAMKKTRQRHWYQFWDSKDVYNQANYEEDVESLKKVYQNAGYKDVVVEGPDHRDVRRQPEEKRRDKIKRRARITIPIVEGERFYFGDVKVEGTTVFPTDRLAPVLRLRARASRSSAPSLVDGMKTLDEIYRGRGYIYVFMNPEYTERPGAGNLVDVVVRVTEGEKFRSAGSSSPGTRRRRTRSSGARSRSSRATSSTWSRSRRAS